MRSYSRLVAIACAALMSVVLFAGSASANRSLSIAPGGAISAVSSGRVTLLGSSGINVIADLTLNGSVVRTVAKTRGTRVGSVTEGRGANGTESLFGSRVTVTVRASPAAPFNLTYETFLGTLPNITGVEVRTEEGAFEIRSELIGNCIYLRGRVPFLLTFPARAEGNAGSFGPNRVTKTAESGSFCPTTGELLGRFVLSPAQRLTLL